MTEPDVTLTDYALGLELGVLTVLVARLATTDRGLRAAFALFFGAGAVAAIAGGTFHGFYSEGVMGTGLWRLALVALGATALAGWAIGATLAFAPKAARWIRRLAALEFIAYGAVVLFLDDSFTVAIANYAPAAVFLLVVFARAWARSGAPGALAGLVGMLTMFLGALVQLGKIAVVPGVFGHNALYHVIQGVAVLFVFAAARWALTAHGR